MKQLRWMATLVVVAVAAGCDGTGLDSGDPPVLPMEESLVIDTETFPSSGGAAAGVARQVASGSHHTAATVGVVGINLAVLAITSIPRLTWAALVSRQPTFEDGRWHWRATTNIVGVNYSGHLTGYADDGDVVAEVRVTTPQLTDFLWYDGRAPIGGTTGQWRFYDAGQPASSVVVSTIDWSHPAEDTWTLTFTAVGGQNPGDNLSYMVDGDLRSVTWYDASGDETYGIGWNAVTSVGYIQTANYNGGVRGCWDGNLQNVTCP